jgi:hypothetical protein
MGACQPSAHDDLHTSIPLINGSVEICRAWPSFRFRLAKIHKCDRQNAILLSLLERATTLIIIEGERLFLSTISLECKTGEVTSRYTDSVYYVSVISGYCERTIERTCDRLSCFFS